MLQMYAYILTIFMRRHVFIKKHIIKKASMNESLLPQHVPHI